VSDEEELGSQDGEIVHATIWCPRRGWGPFYDEPEHPIEDPRQQGFGHFDRIARQVKEQSR
jgi:hypothetical protein